MKKYYAQYRTSRCYIECMTLLPDSEDVFSNHTFDADNDAEAREKAEDYIPQINARYFAPQTTIISLKEIVREVPLTEPAPKPRQEPSQLELKLS